MEKLKPILAQRFWIVIALAALLPVIGWFITTGGVAEAYNKRAEAINGSFSRLPKGRSNPNEKWKADVSKSNVEIQKEIVKAWRELYARQAPIVVWPAEVLEGGQNPYNYDPLKANNMQLEAYREVYRLELDRVWKLAEPGVKVTFPLSRMPQNDWPFAPPTPQQMKDAQEDLWFLTTILKAIRKTNANSASGFDSTIREVATLKLRGGSRPAPGQSPTPAGQAPAAPPPQANPDDPMSADAPVAAPPPPPRVTKAMLVGVNHGEVEFNPNDEFGPETSAPTQNPDGTMGKAVPRRYVDDTPKFKTRGFYLKVIMDHRELPQFQANLASGDMPIRITRVQQVDYMHDDLVDAGGAGSPTTPTTGGSAPPRFGVRPPMNTDPLTTEPGTGTGSGTGTATGSDTDSAGNKTVSLNDPSLAIITISGLITMYKAPPADAPAAAAAPAGGATQGAAPGSSGTPAGAPATTPAPVTGSPEAAAPGSPAATPTSAAPASPAGTASPP